MRVNLVLPSESATDDPRALAELAVAAERQHLLEMPAPVVAATLGYHHVTAAKIASHAGASWSRYAPGDHTRTSDS